MCTKNELSHMMHLERTQCPHFPPLLHLANLTYPLAHLSIHASTPLSSLYPLHYPLLVPGVITLYIKKKQTSSSIPSFYGRHTYVDEPLHCPSSRQLKHSNELCTFVLRMYAVVCCDLYSWRVLSYTAYWWG